MNVIRNLGVVAAGALMAVALAIPASASSLPVAYGFGNHNTGWGHPKVRPGNVYLSDAGTLYATGLTWRSWAARDAAGSGVLHIDNCVPDCAGGTVTIYQAPFALSAIRSHDGRAYYSHMVIRYGSGRTAHKMTLRWDRAQAASLVAWNVTADCWPLTSEGKCYEPGEFCPHADKHADGVAGDGTAIRCEDDDGWRWVDR